MRWNFHVKVAMTPHRKPFFQLLDVHIPLMPVDWGEITNKNTLIVSFLLKLTNDPIQKYGMIILCIYNGKCKII